MSHDCPNTMLQCGFGCGENFKRCETEKHLQCCNKQPVQCPYCTTSVTKDELEIHLKTTCLEYPIECDFCHANLPRRADVSNTFIVAIGT